MRQLDETDYQLLDLLMEDGRMSSAEMARRLNQPVRTVRFRLNRLLQGNLVKVRSILDPAAFGYTVLADVLIETEAGRVIEVAQAAAALPNVSYVACATGDRDISVQVVAEDMDALYRYVTDQLHAIPGVRRTQTVLLPIKMKDVYEWQPENPYESRNNQPKEDAPIDITL